MRFGWLLSVVVLLGSSSCALNKDVLQIKSEVIALRQAVDEIKRSELENGKVMMRSFRDIISHQECPQEDVRKLVSACALGNTGCSMMDIERVVGTMTKMRHVVSYYRPKEAPAQMPPERLALLQTLIKGHQRTINTKILFLVLPYASMNPNASKEADRLGTDYMDYIRDLTPKVRTDGRIPLIDPKVISCERSQDLIRKYESVKADRPTGGEPTSREARMVVWTFMVDC